MGLLKEIVSYIDTNTAWIKDTDLFYEKFKDLPNDCITASIEEGPRNYLNWCTIELTITSRSNVKSTASNNLHTLMSTLNGIQTELSSGFVVWTSIIRGSRYSHSDAQERLYYEGQILVHFAYK